MADRLTYRRIVVKAGTSLLTANTDHLDMDAIASLVGQVARLHQQGAEILLVSSGAVAAGRQVLHLDRGRKDVPFKQVLASVGQGRLMQVYEQLFGEHSIPVAQALLSRRDIADRLGYLNIRNTLLALLELRVVPIINENDVVAVEELAGEAFGDNDTLSAMVANLVDADLLAILGDVEGLYTADPHLDSGAQLIPRVERIDKAIESLGKGSWLGRGTGGMATKLEAARLATASGVAVAIAGGRQPQVLVRLAAGEGIGTFFPALSTRLESRKRWMLSGLSTKGELLVDGGAVAALTRQNRSLLPAGVGEVRGSFHRGDIILIVGPDGSRVACGIANYGSADMDRIKGLRSDQIEETLGYQYGAEVVHRNNMALL